MTLQEPGADPAAVGVDAGAPLAVRALGLAAAWVSEGRRVDMNQLSDTLGVSRVTLFRHVGNREVLLGAALWRLTEQTLRAAERRYDRAPDERFRTVGVMRLFNELVSGAAGLRRLLDDEPALAIRVLTDPRGAVQPGVVAAFRGLLQRDEAEAGLVLLIEADALSFALVRLGESFLYADALASRAPDVTTANRLQRALIEGTA